MNFLEKVRRIIGAGEFAQSVGDSKTANKIYEKASKIIAEEVKKSKNK